jgi:type II secretory pathway component PulJ
MRLNQNGFTVLELVVISMMVLILLALLIWSASIS